jgi:hypothetical protein
MLGGCVDHSGVSPARFTSTTARHQVAFSPGIQAGIISDAITYIDLKCSAILVILNSPACRFTASD